MINVFKIKKWAALFLVAFLSVIAYVVGGLYYGFFGGFLFFGASLVVSLLIGNLLLKNPFSVMIEGGGVLALDINSTGVIRPFVLSVVPPFVIGKFFGSQIRDVFDRKSTASISAPVVSKSLVVKDENGGVSISLTNEDYNNSRFALNHFPCLIFNSQLGKMVSKEFICDNEKSVLAEHLLLYVSSQMESLKQSLLNFGRYVVETTKPKQEWYKSKVFVYVLIGIAVFLIIVLFAPKILAVLQGSAPDAMKGAIDTAKRGSVGLG